MALMNKFRALLATSIASVALLAAIPAPAHADTTPDPVVTVVNQPTAVSGDFVVFDVTVDQPGFVPTNGSQRTTYVSGGATKPDNNYTVIPETIVQVDGVTHYLFTYHASRKGRITFSVLVPVAFSGHLVRSVAGVGIVTVS